MFPYSTILKREGDMQKSYLCFPSSVEACEFLSEFLSVIFMVKNAVENGPSHISSSGCAQMWVPKLFVFTA